MRCTDRRLVAGLTALAGAAGLLLLASCSSRAPAVVPSRTSPDAVTTTAPPGAPVVGTTQTAASARQALPAPYAMRSWNEVRVQAAHRIVSANPDGTYLGVPPEPLLAIPVLEIELNGDGSVRRIIVLRRPQQAEDTIQLAADAVRRAAPFGDVSRLPRPWKFVETFLFDDTRRFKPRTLD